MLKIYWADASAVTEDGTRPLSEYRRRGLETLRHDMARRRAVCVEYLLIEAIQRENPDFPLPLNIGTDENGKPYLAGRAFEFNLSHSGRYAACTISDRPLGLDVQILSQCQENLLRRCFTQEEQDAVLASEDPHGSFTRLWCRKESFLKCTGHGLRLPLASFDVSAGFLTDPDGGREYAFAECRRGELFFCVCTEKTDLPPDISPQFIALP